MSHLYDQRLALLVAAFFLSSPLRAQDRTGDDPPPARDPGASEDAVRVAAAVQAFYDQTRGVRASFRQSYYYKLYDRYERSNGQVTFLKPGMMRFQYAAPNSKTITSDGEQLWVFEPGSGSERSQCILQRVAENQLPQVFSFLTGEGRLSDDFTFRLLDAARYRYQEGDVLELRPKEDSPHYDRILFYVPRQTAEGQNRSSGIVRRVLIIDPQGNRNRFDFSEMRWNPAVDVSNFRFRPPRGVRCTQP